MKATAERAARPARATITPGLARQQREREKTLRRLAKLREKARDEIDLLLAFLDASDLDPDLEADSDDEEVGDEEPSLGAPDRVDDQTGWGAAGAGAGRLSDCELDTSDDEPDVDDEDGRDLEPSLCGVTANGVAGDERDLEYDAAFDDNGTSPVALAAARARDRRNRSNVRLPDGRPIDLATIPSNVRIIEGGADYDHEGTARAPGARHPDGSGVADRPRGRASSFAGG
ncbi:hypothetical protein [Bradyrhizobium sp. JYMT SZCCT0428]|uniref:hypothetical protein n=1 Tax=Bradyrhizobium sp. JYMT SZCCT0428 TaxID=2807673 RepID=UPI001BADB2DA|nr:hypothetical protein [Bradyrhizobium sp. JYMT SZCCT0428]MBR1154873.1 hypothetical protein [Bradyrhizobium sp. JYMT SZCCT0428]